MSLINRLREEYKYLFTQRQQLTMNLTEKEKQLFLNISKSRGLNKNNLSGFFFLNSPFAEVLLTPNYIWQTWFYHRFIHHQTSNQNSISPKVYFETICRGFEDRINDGTFRLNTDCLKADIRKLVRGCLSVYEALQLVSVKSGGEMYEINYDDMPVSQSIDENIYINLYFNLIGKKVKSKPLQVELLPENMRKSITDFYRNWRNIQTNYLLGEQYKLTNQQKNYLGFDVFIYVDEHLLDESLRLLTNEQKRAISKYLKQGNYSLLDLCNLLILKHGASDIKDVSGKYEIYQYVEEYTFSSLWLWIS